jgi:tripartite-type tricarboxylate transporter receptor subunit TctC
VAAQRPIDASSLQAVIERSRREPLHYASTGEGSTAHLLAARLSRAVGIDAQHVPYKDPWMPDLIAGRIHFVVAPTPAVLPQLRAGRLEMPSGTRTTTR